MSQCILAGMRSKLAAILLPCEHLALHLMKTSQTAQKAVQAFFKADALAAFQGLSEDSHQEPIVMVSDPACLASSSVQPTRVRGGGAQDSSDPCAVVMGVLHPHPCGRQCSITPAPSISNSHRSGRLPKGPQALGTWRHGRLSLDRGSPCFWAYWALVALLRGSRGAHRTLSCCRMLTSTLSAPSPATSTSRSLLLLLAMERRSPPPRSARTLARMWRVNGCRRGKYHRLGLCGRHECIGCLVSRLFSRPGAASEGASVFQHSSPGFTTGNVGRAESWGHIASWSCALRLPAPAMRRERLRVLHSCLFVGSCLLCLSFALLLGLVSVRCRWQGCGSRLVGQASAKSEAAALPTRTCVRVSCRVGTLPVFGVRCAI